MKQELTKFIEDFLWTGVSAAGYVLSSTRAAFEWCECTVIGLRAELLTLKMEQNREKMGWQQNPGSIKVICERRKYHEVQSFDSEYIRNFGMQLDVTSYQCALWWCKRKQEKALKVNVVLRRAPQWALGVCRALVWKCLWFSFHFDSMLTQVKDLPRGSVLIGVFLIL